MLLNVKMIRMVIKINIILNFRLFFTKSPLFSEIGLQDRHQSLAVAPTDVALPCHRPRSQHEGALRGRPERRHGSPLHRRASSHQTAERQGVTKRPSPSNHDGLKAVFVVMPVEFNLSASSSAPRKCCSSHIFVSLPIWTLRVAVTCRRSVRPRSQNSPLRNLAFVEGGIAPGNDLISPLTASPTLPPVDPSAIHSG